MEKRSPKNVRFLLADAIREESGGKLTLMGLYSGDEVILQGPVPNEVPEGMQGVALQSLAILAIITDGYGDLRFETKLIDANGRPIGASAKSTIRKPKGSSYNLGFPYSPFPVPAFGRYRFLLKFDSTEFEYDFVVRHQDPNAVLPTKQVQKQPENISLSPSVRPSKKKKKSGRSNILK